MAMPDIAMPATMLCSAMPRARLAIATASDAASRKARILGGREWVRLGAVEMGLDCLRRYLQGLPVYERIDFEKT